MEKPLLVLFDGNAIIHRAYHAFRATRPPTVFTVRKTGEIVTAVYGFAQTPERMALQEISSIDNLHYASAWTRTGGGFSGAIMGGYICAFNLLRKRE